LIATRFRAKSFWILVIICIFIIAYFAIMFYRAAHNFQPWTPQSH
jgi:hypothetical protein